METKPYTIRRGEQHLPQEESVELRIHGGPVLHVLRSQDYVVDLTADQVHQLEADGYVVKSAKARKPAKASALAAPDSTLPPWPLETSPADYIAQHENDTDPSPAVAERLTLAQRHVAAAGEE